MHIHYLIMSVSSEYSEIIAQTYHILLILATRELRDLKDKVTGRVDSNLEFGGEAEDRLLVRGATHGGDSSYGVVITNIFNKIRKMFKSVLSR